MLILIAKDIEKLIFKSSLDFIPLSWYGYSLAGARSSMLLDHVLDVIIADIVIHPFWRRTLSQRLAVLHNSFALKC